jgi:flagellar hook-basal body complex protein FliE
MDPISSVRIAAQPGLQSATFAQRAPGLGRVSSASELAGLSTASEPAAPGGAVNSFEGMLQGFVAQVNQQQVTAGQAVSGLLSGQGVPLHQAVIAMEEANVSFQLMVEVRNKLLESYQELMRMQI